MMTTRGRTTRQQTKFGARLAVKQPTLPMSHKFYCYVDETGQDTRGALFVVAAVIAAEDREHIRELLRSVEFDSQKAKKKWTKATIQQRRAYMERVLQSTALQGRLYYTTWRVSRETNSHG